MSQASDQTPPIRLFQFDDDGIGALKNSVNLFRGDVNLPLTLFTLTGRNSLDVKVSLLGQSNVQDQVDRWSLDAPTSVVGLGWSMPLERIEADDKNTGTQVYDDYYLVTQDARQLLEPTTNLWQRLTMSSSLASHLDRDNGSTVSSDVLAAFTGAGIALSASAVVTMVTAGKEWQIEDPHLEETFSLQLSGSEIVVYDGGLPFETRSFQFWRIRYYPQYEKWAVTREDGTTSVYGGGVSTRSPYTSDGNSVCWSVRWGNWLGPSSLTDSTSQTLLQAQFATGWYLRRVESVWGDCLTYYYDAETQNVGSDGLPYTKAIYLSGITDVFGRRVEFDYANKLVGTETSTLTSCSGSHLPAGVREVMDPHQATAGNTPNAFQDRYEDRYLTEIEVFGADDQPIFAFVFNYCLQNVSVYSSDDPRYLDTFKRYLTSIQLVNILLEELPGIELTYNWTTDTSKNRGALSSITYPEGGSVTWDYEQATLSNLDRQVTIANPYPGYDAQPRVWFGNNYAVVTWYRNGTHPQLQVQVWSWLAGWYNDSSTTYTFDVAVDVDSLQVVAQSDFFALAFYDQTHSANCVYLYHQDVRAFGQWLAYAPSPNNFGSSDSSPPALVAGDRFVVVAYEDSSNQYHVDRFTWERQGNDAQICAQTSPLPNAYGWTYLPDIPDLLPSGLSARNAAYYITAHRNYYGVLCYDATNNGNNRFQLFYMNTAGQWFAGPVATPNFTALTQYQQARSIQLTPSDTFVALSAIAPTWGDQTDYVTFVFQWGPWDGTSTPLVTTSHTGSFDYPVPIGAQAAGDALAGFGPTLLRYDGCFGCPAPGGSSNTNGWLGQSFDMQLLGADGVYHWFATGPGYALKCDFVPGYGINAQLAPFDADTDVSSWSTPVQTLLSSGSPHGTRRYFITAGGEDYFTFDLGVYYRGQTTDWASAASEKCLSPLLGASLPSGQAVDTFTLQNQAPYFIAYPVVTSSGPVRTEVMYLRNGGFVSGTPEQLAGETLYSFVSLLGSQVDTHTQGKVAGGNGCFFTYPVSASLDQAQHVTLYRCLQNGVTGALTDFRVRSLAISFDGSGSGTSYTSFSYDDDHAGFDPGGAVAKYFQVTTSSGASPGDQTNGYQVTCYLNGLPSSLSGGAPPSGYDQVYSMLDGMLLSKTTYDGGENEIRSTTNTWSVYPCISTSAGPHALYGTWARQTARTDTLDGVATTTNTAYDQSTGLPQTISFTTYGGDGQKHTHTRTMVYGSSVYSWMLWHNVLVRAVQTTTAIDGQPTSAVAHPFSAWSRPNPNDGSSSLSIWAQAASYAWQGGSGQPSFGFSDWQAGQSVSGWLLRSSNLNRNGTGQVVENQDACGVVSSMLFDRSGLLSVALFPDASLSGQEADYFGCETYELNPGWQLLAGASIESGVAHAGWSAIAIPEGPRAVALQRTLSPRRCDRPYVFSFWYRTDPACPAGSIDSPGVFVDVTPSSGSSKTIQGSFSATEGAWNYFSQVVDLTPYAHDRSVSVCLSVCNATNTALWIDDLMFAPLSGLGSAQVYDGGLQNVIAQVGPGNQTQYTVFDFFQRHLATVGADGNPKQIRVPYLSRQAGGSYVTSAPNAHWQITPAGSGFYDDFGREADASAHWTGTGWSSPFGYLQGEGTLTLNGGPRQDFGLRLLVVPVSKQPAALGLRIGSTTIQWNPSSSSWSLGSQTVKTSGLAYDWMLLTSGATLLFLADGQLIFSHVASDTIAGTVEIFANNSVYVANILYFEQPRVTVTYMDGGGRAIQAQAQEGTTFTVQETLYDVVGRKAVETRSGRFTADNHDNLLLAYRPGFVSSFDWQTGVLAGELADQYTADGGYPYSRVLYEAAPGGRPVEKGLPGSDYAINLNEPAASRHTVKIAYGNNGGGAAFPPASKLSLPSGQYRLTTTTDANGRVSYQLASAVGEPVASGVATSGGLAMSSKLDSVDSSAQVTSTYRLPNYYSTPTPASHQDFVRIEVRDALGLVRQASEPDSATPTKLIYDNLGRVRFLQDSNGAAGTGVGQPYALYVKYDSLGRTVEKGWFACTWGDGSSLQTEAQSDPTYPPSSLARPVKTYTFDGDGSDPDQISRLVSATTSNRDLSHNTVQTVAESFTYDIAGNVLSKTLATAAWDSGASQIVAYSYDNTGATTQTVYLADSEGNPTSGGMVVAFGYDLLGRMTSVTEGDGGSQQTLGTFSYTPDGQLEYETCAAGTPGALSMRRCYSSPGWLTDLQVVSGTPGQLSCADSASTVFAEHLSYTSGGYGGAGYWNQLIASATVSFPTLTSPPSGFYPSYVQRFAYDDFYRLATAQLQVSSQEVSAWSLGADSHPVTYDDNGNLSQVRLGSTSRQYSYRSGTDQLCNTTGSSCHGSGDPYQYDALGNVTTATPEQLGQLSYDPSTRRTTRIVTSSETVDLLYGHVSQRVLKSSGSTSRLYLHGVQANPLIEKVSASGSETTTFYVYGPGGLMTAISGSKRYTVIRDHAGSNRGLFDSTGQLVAAYSYLPFGGFLGSTWEKSDSAPIAYLYTGQELDSETGLYNFHARLYDPALGRFYGQDPAQQQTSPYALGYNNPLLFVDPTGMFSWEAFGLALAAVALAAVGVVAIAVSGGAAAPAVVGAETGLISTTAGATGAAATEGALSTVAAATQTALVGAGASQGVASAVASVVESTVSIAGNAALSAGANGAAYAITSGDHANVAGWASALASGAITGALSGAAGALAKPFTVTNALTSMGSVSRFFAQRGIDMLQGAVGNAAGGAAVAALHHHSLARAALLGAATGAALSPVKFGGKTGFKSVMKKIKPSEDIHGSFDKGGPAFSAIGAFAAAGKKYGLSSGGPESEQTRAVARSANLEGVNYQPPVAVQLAWHNVQPSTSGDDGPPLYYHIVIHVIS